MLLDEGRRGQHREVRGTGQEARHAVGRAPGEPAQRQAAAVRMAGAAAEGSPGEGRHRGQGPVQAA